MDVCLLTMSQIAFGQNCRFVRHLQELSMLDGNDHRSKLAAVLLFELGYPYLIQNVSDIRFTADLASIIKQIELNSLVPEGLEACAQCDGLGRCRILAQAEAAIQR